MKGDIRAVRHYLNNSVGGLARCAEYLIGAQIQLAQRPCEFYGPASDVRLLPGTPRRAYQSIKSVSGLNQWKFALQSSWQRSFDNVIRHYHNFGLGSIDVFTAHGLYSQHWQANRVPGQKNSPMSLAQFRALSALEKHVFRQARVVVFLATEVRNYVEQEMNIRRPGHFIVIPPGVDGAIYNSAVRHDVLLNRKKFFPGQDPRSRWLLFVGNDYKGKGLLRLLEGLKEIERSNNEKTTVDVLVFGNDRANSARASALARSLSVKVCFFESDASLRAAYGLSDILMMDSLSEGFPLVLLESMSAGCVPFVTRFGGVPDVVQHEVNGHICANAVDVIFQALSAPDSRLQSMSKQAVETARQYTWRKTAEEYEAVYRSL